MILRYVNYASATGYKSVWKRIGKSVPLANGGSNARFGFCGFFHLRDMDESEPVNMGIHIGLNYMFEEVSF